MKDKLKQLPDDVIKLMVDEFYSIIDETVKERSITTFDASYLNHFRESLKEKVKEKFNI